MPNSRLNSFKYAFKGIADLFRNTPNARIHLAVAVAVLVCGFAFGISLLEWCVVLLAMGAVLAAEALNTALEYLTDLVSPDYHELAGKAKDAAAGGVLLMAMAAAAAGLVVFLPKGWALASQLGWW